MISPASLGVLCGWTLRPAKAQDVVFLARKTEPRKEDRAEKNEKRRKNGVALRAASLLSLFFRLLSFLSAMALLVVAGGRAGPSVAFESMIYD